MSRRRAQGPSVSFFAFQDIITSVVGIFVLITLIMMVDLVRRTGSSSASQELVADTFSVAIADLEMQLEQIAKRSRELDVLASKIGAVQVFNKDEIAKDLGQVFSRSTSRSSVLKSGIVRPSGSSIIKQKLRWSCK